MATYLSTEKRQEIFNEFGGDKMNSGSPEGQVALFTFRITELSNHLQSNKKDHSARRRLLELVGKRKGILNYLSKKDINRYRAIIEKLKLRK